MYRARDLDTFGFELHLRLAVQAALIRCDIKPPSGEIRVFVRSKPGEQRPSCTRLKSVRPGLAIMHPRVELECSQDFVLR
jgi:hypothetical protein